MSGLALPACLVTQPIHFEEPEGFPPSIETPFDTPWRLSEIVRIDASDDETEQDFEVEVRDPDVDQTLEYLVYVDYAGMDLPGVGADRFGEIPTVDPAAGTDRTRRRISFSLPEQATGLSAPGCHRIEMLVSGRFRSQSRQPVADGDLGTAVWWVATQRDGSTVDMVACP